MQDTRIRLYGKKDCEQCERAKDKLRRMGLSWEFIDVSSWFVPQNDWRDRYEETVEFMAAYSLYYPMPLPLFRFDDDEYLGYAEGLKQAKIVSRALREVERRDAVLAVA